MNTRRRMNGVVTSDKMQKTVVVEVSHTYRHRLYKKVVHSRRRFMAHDELGCKIGDRVRIIETRPMSRHKRWMVEEILRHEIAAGGPDLEAVLEESAPEAEA
jgi:small subunit ribosomal protein S17